MHSVKEQMAQNGYAIIDNFLSEEEILESKQGGIKFIEQALQEEHKFKFGTGSSTPQASDRYFIDSADKISFFFEPNAFNENGTLKVDSRKSLNKVGHALHKLEPTFRRLTFNEKVAQVCRELGLTNPCVIQSMYIYKNPRIGGEVSTHQDASYLYTEPRSLYGFWFALDDATLENGCLWFHPGSHVNDQVSYRFIRNPDKDSTKLCIGKGESNLISKEEDFVPVSVPRGSCILIHGNVIHRSLTNRSDKPRNVYTFHIYDKAMSKYSDKNWLQTEFESIY